MSLRNILNSNHANQSNTEEYHPPKKKSYPMFHQPNSKTPDKSVNAGPSQTSPYFQHNSQHVDIETAYNCRNYQQVLKLLQEDKEFPGNFNFRDLDNSYAGGKELRQFVLERNKLHKFIMKNNVEEIKKIFPNQTGKLYLSCKNQSALHAALTKNSFETYSYLVSKDAQFKDASEKEALTKLENENKRKLQAAISDAATSIENKHIKYLISKSTFLGQNVIETLIKFYEDLNDIPEVSVMFEVLQFRDIQILFDFYRKEVDHVAPSSATNKDVGLMKRKENKIFIAANPSRGRNNILGTIAHECTHMAMEIVFENEGNPYKAEDKENKKKFDDIVLRVKNLDQKCFSAKRNAEGIRIETLYQEFFNLYKNDEVHPSELIVTVPQILAENGNDKRWLSKNVPNLLNFYNEIVLKCKEFIKTGRDYLHKSSIVNFNKCEGEINRLKDLEIFFQDLNGFLESNNERVTIVLSENSTLTMLRVLQKLYGNDFTSRQENFLVLKFSTLIKSDDIYDCVRPVIVKTLLIEFDVSDDKDVEEGVNVLFDIFKDRPSINYVIAVTKNEEKLKIELKKAKLKTVLKEDKNFSLNDLVDSSIDKVLHKIIYFQEKKIKLNELISRDENLFKSINLKTAGKLCCEEKIEIGGKIVGTSSLEGAYADVIEEININRFCNKINSKDDFIFIVSGLHGQKKEKQLYLILKAQSKAVKFDNSLCEECTLPKAYEKRKIILTDSELSSKSFNEFCFLNPRKKIYLINIVYKYEDTEPIFILKRYYNPDFYTERKFKEKHIKTARATLIKQCKDEQFKIISHAKTKINLTNVEYFEKEDEAEKAFEESSRNNATVHLLSAEDPVLIWKKSSGSIKNILKHVTKSKKSYTEDRLIKMIENQKVVLFADDPGMGKSTTVTKLYEKNIKNQSLCRKNWVIRINLRDHLDAIQTIDVEKFNIDMLIRFLSEIDKDLKSDLNLNFLRLAVSSDKFLKPLLIVMDGYDELSNEIHREKIKSLMKFLKNRTNCKLWVTTRLNFKEELENELCVVSKEFDSINEAKNKFITNYFKDRLDLVVKKTQMDERLKKYVSDFIINLKNTFKDSEKFIGAPLQLYLMLENSIDGCREFIENSNLSSPDFSGLGNDLLNIYNKFLIMKYDVYFKKFSLNSINKLLLEVNCDFFNCYNKNFVDCRMFKSDFTEFLNKFKPLMLETGIIKAHKGDIEFIHLSFKEYFCSEVIIEYLKDKRERKLDIHLIEILIKKIFLIPDHQLLRNFLNLHLGKINFAELPSHNLKSIGQIMAFLYGEISVGKDKNGTVLHVAVKEKNKNIFNFLIHCCKETFTNDQFRNLLITTNSGFLTIFHVAVLANELSFFKFVISKIKSLHLGNKTFNELLNFKYKMTPKYKTPLELARSKGYDPKHKSGKLKMEDKKKSEFLKIAQCIEEELSNVNQVPNE